MNLKDLHDKICTTLKKEISAIQTCEVYPVIRKELVAPAVFVELSGFEKGHDPGTEELALKARFEARIVIDSTIENAAIIVRSLASEVAKVVNKNTWNVENVSPGEFISGGGDDFRPELDAYLVWLVEWTHYPANNVAKNVKLEKSISRKLLCPKTRVPFIYSANNQLTISFNE